MSIKVYSIKCPSCNSSLPIEEGRMQIFCSYCGSNIIVNNENEFTYRITNDAEIKWAESEQIIRLKELELSEKEFNNRNRLRNLKIKASIILAIVGIVTICLGDWFGDISGDPNSSFYMISALGILMIMVIGFIWS